MKTLVITAFFSISTFFCFSQQTIRWNPYQLLKWDDFNGEVNDSSRYDAECYAEISYSYKYYGPEDVEFEVFANFNKASSWSRKEKQSDALLRHEQTHFNIAALYAAKLEKEFNSSSYTASFNSQVQDLFNEKKLEYQTMQQQYDDETNHSLNKEKQKEWEEFIEIELRKARSSIQLAQTDTKDVEKGK